VSPKYQPTYANVVIPLKQTTEAGTHFERRHPILLNTVFDERVGPLLDQAGLPGSPVTNSKHDILTVRESTIIRLLRRECDAVIG
jgi:hypothetical protein